MICIGGHDECVGSRRIGDKGRDEAEDLLSFDHFSIYCDRISSADASEKWYAWIGGRPKGNVREYNGDDWEDIQMI